jgi:benzodiazapine receptor
MSKTVKLLMSLVACFLTGVIGSYLTSPSIHTWYARLTKPNFTPPDAVFGPVWTLLFILMAVSLFLVINQPKRKDSADAVLIFAVQLLVNVSWSLLFFTLHQPLYAFIAIISLWLLILACILLFNRLNKLAAYLLIPYLAWVSFAAVLNFSLYLLNR